MVLVMPAVCAKLRPSERDPDWQAAFDCADLLYSEDGRPDFEKLLPIENCTAQDDSKCTALWYPGLGNGFLGSIAQSPTIRIAGYLSGDYGRYTAGKTIPPVPSEGFPNKEYAYRARIPAYASSIIIGGSALQPGSARAALNLREAVYYERTSLTGGGEFELRTYFHRTRRNVIVVEASLDCGHCNQSATVSMRAFSGQSPRDVLFEERPPSGAEAARAAASSIGSGSTRLTPRRLFGRLRAAEKNAPDVSHLYDTNHTLGYVHDRCPSKLTAAAGKVIDA